MSVVLLTIYWTLVSLVGAWVSLKVRGGWPWWLLVFPGAAMHAGWAIATRYTTMNLVVLSAWFDVVVALAWFGGFWWLGKENITPQQWAGVALLCAGMALINWR